MKEILVLSGKGGTGKTTITASLALLAQNSVLADCDVDASDLHLLVSPNVQESHDFWSGVTAKVDPKKCTGCGTCAELCRFEAVFMGEKAYIDHFSCEGCTVCAHFCPEDAIELEPNLSGEWYISETKYGAMVHARLHVGEENSGKLVSLVKRESRELAEEIGAKWIIVDGPPGIGCPVISSFSGADLVLAVTEPTSSGLQDLERLIELACHFKTDVCVCINKWDLNESFCNEIEVYLEDNEIPLVAKIPFDKAAVDSLVAGKPILEYTNGLAADAIRKMWPRIEAMFLS